jgi:hypothetical protein
LFNIKTSNLINLLSILLATFLFSSHSFSKGKIYGNSKTLSKEYIKYEKCRLKETLINIKDGQKDGYKCVYKRQGRGKDITVFQPSAICQKSFKCKTEIQ